MMFCPKCGSILVPKKDSNKYVLSCSCGYTNEDTQNAKLKDEIKEKDDIVVIDKEFDAKPVVEAECTKCGNNEAYFWTQQTRSSDEPETKFFKCTVCKYTWRDYS
jgi:DNA-directed RNA polymerase subunit M